ncbi:hypothetical protein [Mesorhizobium sp.]|uniref:hypothetical protein n=1 Tax=Mesorhizobium sp. TaxID=1871066 RepID=UPI000FE54F37|nr:hypothetical protein [Mesorhizobium sp.]RWD49701.1 MAG: hypothetical protein EOS59_13135 [Mesorhizobium sp.]
MATCAVLAGVELVGLGQKPAGLGEAADPDGVATGAVDAGLGQSVAQQPVVDAGRLEDDEIAPGASPATNAAIGPAWLASRRKLRLDGSNMSSMSLEMSQPM